MDAFPPGLGLFARVGERLILRILRKVPVRELLRLMEASKSMWCFANYNKIWKRICIKRWEGTFNWKGTWKLTALLPYHCDMAARPPPLRVPQAFYDQFPVIGPRMRRVTIPIDNLTSTRQDLPYVDALTTTVEEFIETYDRGNKPCIIRNAMVGWPAMENWTMEKLVARFANRRLLTDEVNSRGHKMKMTLDAYFKYFVDNVDDDPVYMFDPKFVKHAGEEIRADYEVPKYFTEDLFSVLSKDERPFYRWIVLGPKRSGSCFHLDPYYTSAWNALVKGTKRWVMFPPGWIPPGVMPNGRGDYDAPIPVKWFLKEYYKNPNGNANDCHPIVPGAVECQQQAGEVIWVPSGWWHQVLNVTDTFAVTQNLCNSANWRAVWPDVLKDRPMAEELKEKLGPTRPDLFPDYKEWLAARKAAAEAAAAAEAQGAKKHKKKGKKKGKNGAKKHEGKKK